MLNRFSSYFNCNKRLIIQGGGVAAPIASQVLGEVIPYMELQKNTEEASTEKEKMPNVIGLKQEEAIKILKEKNFEVELKNQENESQIDGDIITMQIPIEGVEVLKGTKVIITK